MPHLLSLLFSFTSAQAMVLEPTFEAAEKLGFQVVGELEFKKDSAQFDQKESERQRHEIGELCPRTQSYDPNISSFIRFLILAWSDQDFPSRKNPFQNSHQQWLAEQRAKAVATTLRDQIKGNLEFELVNMANRKPHLVQTSEVGLQPKGRFDVKAVFEHTGAAPSDALGFGLFAEYSQAAKAVVMVECNESLAKKRNRLPSLVQLAMNGAIATSP